MAGVLYLGMNLFALLFSNSLIFAPREPSYTHLPHEVKITTGGGETITAVYLENPDAEFTLLFSHGNAEDLGRVIDFLQEFYTRGYSLLMYDYRGYGTSEGTPSVRKAYQDVDAAYHWLVQEKGIDPATIISQGRSVGGGPATWLAAHRPVGGLAVESTFVTAFRVRTVIPLLPWDRLNNLQNIQRVNCPVLVIHGRDDRVIPFWHAEKLYDAAPGQKMHLWINEAEHNDYAYVGGERYFQTYDAFMEMVRASSGSSEKNPEVGNH